MSGYYITDIKEIKGKVEIVKISDREDDTDAEYWDSTIFARIETDDEIRWLAADSDTSVFTSPWSSFEREYQLEKNKNKKKEVKKASETIDKLKEKVDNFRKRVDEILGE